MSNFFGVYIDNLLKNAIIFISVAWSMPYWLNQSQLISLVSAALVVPYLILSPLAGRLAIRYSKLSIYRLFKLLEFPIVFIASLAFLFESVFPAILAVFLMGIQSCLYSPSKYSLIRDIGGEDGVSYGSGVFETMAFLGILLGAVTASLISDFFGSCLLVVLMWFVSLAGYFSTRAIKAKELPVLSPSSELNPFRFLKLSYCSVRGFGRVNLAVFGSSAFWMIGGMLQMNLVIHSKQVYELSNTATGIVMSLAAIGIAIGTSLAGVSSGKVTRVAFVLPGLFAMIGFLLILAFVHLPVWLYAISVFLLAFAGGFFHVPLLATIQQSDVGRRLGDVIAYLNLVTFIFVLIGTAFFSLTTMLSNENSFVVFGVIAAISILVMTVFIRKAPEFVSESGALLSKLLRKGNYQKL
ncbi:MAG: MFS transporter [Paludibacteraceae bacterium]|nr:MFS transporter [Paludibacteraceae bacterium]